MSLVNTFLAMAIDVETRRPKLSNVLGGLSGPAIRPIAVRMVWECFQTVKIPIIGMGGITDAADAVEFMLAGLDRRADRHRQFRRSVRLDEGPRRPRRLPAAPRDRARHRADRRRWTRRRGRRCTHEPDPGRPRRRLGGTRLKRWPTRSAATSAGSRSASSSSPPKVPRSSATLADARRSRVSRSEVSRHPEHRRGRGRIGGRDRRVDGQRARLRRPEDDGGCRGRRRRDRRHGSARQRPLVIGVTVLTSLDDAQLREIGVERERARSGRAPCAAGAGRPGSTASSRPLRRSRRSARRAVRTF